MLVDSHCHLTAEQFTADLPAVLARCWDAGLAHLVVIGESPEAAARAVALAETDQRISATAGLHPHEASRWTPALAGWLEGTLADPRVVAVGETGLDYHYDFSPRPAQAMAFEAQLEIAGRAGRPAVIHAREADDNLSAILTGHRQTTAILHSFSSGLGLLRRALDLGHYVSFSGMVTFRNWALDEAIRLVPADRLLVETDAPYLAPVPYRGKRNEPAFVRHTAERVARVRNVALAELIEQTGANAMRVFGPRLSSSNPVDS